MVKIANCNDVLEFKMFQQANNEDHDNNFKASIAENTQYDR